MTPDEFAAALQAAFDSWHLFDAVSLFLGGLCGMAFSMASLYKWGR